MSKVENKSKVDFRMKPLLVTGVRLQYKNSTFSIVEYDWFDNLSQYVVHVSDRTDPFEFTMPEMKDFLDSLVRKDGVAIPKFDEAATAQPPVPKKYNPAPRKAGKAVDEELEDDEEVIEVPEETENEHIEENTMGGGKLTQPAPAPKRSGQFVHIESTVKIYVTRDYSLFGVLQGNRVLNKSKIKKIKEEIAAGTNLLQYCPIVVVEVDGKLKVIDGQHRLEVAKQIGSYVWYVISAPLSLYEIAKMNSNTEKWKGADFINCYVATGDTSYKTLKEFNDTYRLPLGVNLQLLTKGYDIGDNSPEELADRFQSGKLVVSKEKEALEIAQMVCKFEEFKGYKSRGFIVALCVIKKAGKITIDAVLKAFQKNGEILTVQSGYKNYLVNIEQMVNVGKHSRIVVY